MWHIVHGTSYECMLCSACRALQRRLHFWLSLRNSDMLYQSSNAHWTLHGCRTLKFACCTCTTATRTTASTNSRKFRLSPEVASVVEPRPLRVGVAVLARTCLTVREIVPIARPTASDALMSDSSRALCAENKRTTLICWSLCEQCKAELSRAEPGRRRCGSVSGIAEGNEWYHSAGSITSGWSRR